eukprot:COSAG03_NODE_722_length_6101_cov_3031.874209_5_plen_86_part_00
MRDVLRGDWRFRRSLAAQHFSSAAICLRYRDWHVEKADGELSFVGNSRRAGEARVFARARSRRRSDRRLAFSTPHCSSNLQLLGI